jgi:hypothetical protein
MLSVVPMCVAEELGLPVVGKMLFFDRGGSAERAHLLASSDVEVVLIGVRAVLFGLRTEQRGSGSVEGVLAGFQWPGIIVGVG